MPDPAEFEEKEFEIPLYNELANGSPFLWSPGQVLEQSLGIDGAQLTYDATLWKLLGLGQQIPRGVPLNRLASLLRRRRLLPSFRCNLLLQIKRPYYMMNRTNGYHGSCPYYRFTLDHDQQVVLERVATKVADRAFVGYMSPAFYKLTDLYNYIVTSSLVLQSTVVEVNLLTNHRHWAYDRPGTHGVACSDPKEINGEPLTDIIEKLIDINYGNKFLNDNEVSKERINKELKELADSIYEVCVEECKPGNWIGDSTRDWLKLTESHWDKNTPESIINFAKIQRFCYINGISWFVVG